MLLEPISSSVTLHLDEGKQQKPMKDRKQFQKPSLIVLGILLGSCHLDGSRSLRNFLTPVVVISIMSR